MAETKEEKKEVKKLTREDLESRLDDIERRLDEHDEQIAAKAAVPADEEAVEDVVENDEAEEADGLEDLIDD